MTQRVEETPNDREEMIEHLTEYVTGDRKEAELRMLDDDLWLLHPELRYSFEGEEAVREWERSLTLVRALYEFAMTHHGPYPFFSDSTTWLIGDAEARAEEALRRARERVREAR
jgi:hypothetical protein